MDISEPLGALADPTRRAIYDLIRQAPSSVRELSDQLPISQPAVSQHLAVLRAAQLVTSTPQGARRIYSIDPVGIERLRDWVESLWSDVLDSFTAAADQSCAKQKEYI